MKKLSSDVVHRMFHALSQEAENESVIKTLDSETFLKCFLSGESQSNWLKGVKKRRVDLGREIKVSFNGTEKTFLTSQLFERPICLWKIRKSQYFGKEFKETKYLFRHPFSFEDFLDGNYEVVNTNDSNLQEFLINDKFDELMKIKDETINEIAQKFQSNDVRVVNSMTEVLEEHFLDTGEKLDNLAKRFETFFESQETAKQDIIENQNLAKIEILENQEIHTRGIENLMLEMTQIRKRLENPSNNEDISNLQLELEATKQSLEEEKLSRKLSRRKRNPVHSPNNEAFLPSFASMPDLSLRPHSAIGHLEISEGFFYFITFHKNIFYSLMNFQIQEKKLR